MIWRSYLIGPCRNRSATSRDGPQRRRTATIAYVRPARPTAGAHMTQYALPEPSQRARDRYNRMLTFMREDVLPAEPEYLAAGSAAGPSGHEVSPVIERLKGPGEVGRPVEPVPSLGVGDHPARVRPHRRALGVEQRPSTRGDQLPGARRRKHGRPPPAG